MRGKISRVVRIIRIGQKIVGLGDAVGGLGHGGLKDKMVAHVRDHGRADGRERDPLGNEMDEPGLAEPRRVAGGQRRALAEDGVGEGRQAAGARALGERPLRRGPLKARKATISARV